MQHRRDTDRDKKCHEQQCLASRSHHSGCRPTKQDHDLQHSAHAGRGHHSYGTVAGWPVGTAGLGSVQTARRYPSPMLHALLLAVTVYSP